MNPEQHHIARWAHGRWACPVCAWAAVPRAADGTPYVTHRGDPGVIHVCGEAPEEPPPWLAGVLREIEESGVGL